MNSSRWKPMFSFLVATAASAAASTVLPVRAWDNRSHATLCEKYTLGTGTYGVNADGHVYNANSTDSMDLMCPITDNSAQPKTDVVTRNIHVYDGNNDADATGQVFAWLCVSYWDVLGSECGAGDNSGNTFTGNDTLSPALTSWANASDFGFIIVRLPDFDVANSYLRGWYLRNS